MYESCLESTAGQYTAFRMYESCLESTVGPYTAVGDAGIRLTNAEMSHLTICYQSCHTYEWVMSHISESGPQSKREISLIKWVMSRINGRSIHGSRWCRCHLTNALWVLPIANKWVMSLAYCEQIMTNLCYLTNDTCHMTPGDAGVIRQMTQISHNLFAIGKTHNSFVKWHLTCTNNRANDDVH